MTLAVILPNSARIRKLPRSATNQIAYWRVSDDDRRPVRSGTSTGQCPGEIAMVSSRPVSRAIVLVSSTLALMLAVLVGGPRSVSADTKSDAEAVVQSYYSAIDAFAYKEAYANFGSAWQKGQSLSNFTNGFTDTAFVELDVK